MEVLGPQLQPGAREQGLLAGDRTRQDPGKGLSGGVENGQRRRDGGIDGEPQGPQLADLRDGQGARQAEDRLFHSSRARRAVEVAGIGQAREQPGERRAPFGRVAARAQDGSDRRPRREIGLEREAVDDRDGPVRDVALDQLAGLVEAVGEEVARDLAEEVLHLETARRGLEGHNHGVHSSPCSRRRPGWRGRLTG